MRRTGVGGTEDMIYNFHHFYYWLKGGVETGQAYRAKIFRSLGLEAKFIFATTFPENNIQHETEYLGFSDSEVIWMYDFFTDCGISPVTYTLEQLENSFEETNYSFSRDGNVARYYFPESNIYWSVFLTDETGDLVHRVMIISDNKLIRKDYYTYCRIYSEYYAPLDHKAHLYHRRFFNEDGTVAYEEIIDDGAVMYQFPDRLLCSKEELVGYMVSRLKLTRKDVVLIDRTTGIGQAILQNAGPAKIGIVIHADHYSEGGTDEEAILWNNYYEYAFSQRDRVRFYITSTEVQNRLLKQQFKKYMNANPKVVTIPVGSLKELKVPKKARKKHSLITASRLASEKHVDWIIDAVAAAREQVKDLSLDIYGKGGEEGKLKEQIKRLHCEDYVHLCGQQDLQEVYKNYEAYVSGSTSEGFGLTLMEAEGSGLPVIGFDVRYGNPNFIEDGENGYLISVNDKMEKRERVQKLADCIVRLFKEADLEKFRAHSYDKAKEYLTKEVEKKWENILK